MQFTHKFSSPCMLRHAVCGFLEDTLLKSSAVLDKLFQAQRLRVLLGGNRRRVWMCPLDLHATPSTQCRV